MAKKLSILLNAKEPLFTTSLRQLEALAGHKAVDVAYVADVMARAHKVMRKIGLDPADTTEKELYAALNAHVDDRQLFAQTDDVALLFGRDRIVSFNHEDVVENTTKLYEQRTVRHMRCEMKHALTARYVNADGDNEIMIREIVAQSGLDACDLAEYHEQKMAAKALRKRSASPYILCIGDIFTDVFIKLLENEARIDTDRDGSKRLSLPFGNKPPYDSVETVHSVGPSPNAAVSMARLGCHVGLMSWLGGDQTGKDSLAYLAGKKVDTTYVSIQKKLPSNTYYVLRYGADRTILVKNQSYNYQWKTPKVTPDWLYLSLTSADSWPLHQQLADYLDEHPNVKLAFQPGTFHFKWGAKKLTRLYRRTEIVVMNREEAEDVTGKKKATIRQLADALHELGPQYVVITDGAKGAYALYDDTLLVVPNYPDPAPPLDRTGAGDAFASTIVAALAQGVSIDEALLWAPINSMSVVQSLGAQAGLLSKNAMKEYLKKAPNDYQCKEYTR